MLIFAYFLFFLVFAMLRDGDVLLRGPLLACRIFKPHLHCPKLRLWNFHTMGDFKTKRDSRMKKTLSWIAGTDRAATRRITKPSPTARSKRPKSLLSFLPSILDNGLVEDSYQNAIPPSPTQPPPAPFFHSRPLPRTPEIEHSRFADQTADSSLSSLTSDEIAQWKVRYDCNDEVLAKTELFNRYTNPFPIQGSPMADSAS